MLTLKRLDLRTFDWDTAFASLPDRLIFQSPAWLSFLHSTVNTEPVVAALYDGRDAAGYFTGMVVERFGIRILGSPFPGWTTPYMGFNLAAGVSRRDALEALRRFAFHDLNCVHMELVDRNFTDDDVIGTDFEIGHRTGFEVDLNLTEDELFKNMDPDCRRRIRKAKKAGLRIETVEDESFADECYAQMSDVFARQQLVPTYPVARMREIIRQLQPTGMLLMLRAITPEGECAATSMTVGMHDRAFWWAAASWRHLQHWSPNELLKWVDLVTWKNRGVRYFDFAGAGEYKAKYGGYRISIPWLRASKYAFIGRLRDRAKELTHIKQHVLGTMHQWVGPHATGVRTASALETQPGSISTNSGRH